MIYIMGMGAGGYEGLTIEESEIIAGAKCLLGAKRLLDNIPDDRTHGEKKSIIRASEIVGYIEEHKEGDICVLFSGDTGFYSGADGLKKVLDEREYKYRIIPNASSFSVMASRIGVDYRSSTLVSLHGRCGSENEFKRAVTGALMKGRSVFFLTGGENSPARIAKVLVDAGLSDVCMYIGVSLGESGETLVSDSAEVILGQSFADPNIVYVPEVHVYKRRIPGIDDEEFIRGDIPMTKKYIRSAVISEMAAAKGKVSVIWDIGAGTGSVSVETALCFPDATVQAVEIKDEGISLIKENRKKFHTYNMEVICGAASDILGSLENPDVVFIGGSGGELYFILEYLYRSGQKIHVVMTAVTIDTISEIHRYLEEKNMEASMCEIAVSNVKKIGSSHMLRPESPVFIISFDIGGEAV
ncbi:MAG: precorrin-6y C5,15-methyltransferase (decarboxylating) subunit CbiE [Lachnospiraceae bacterium]|nr:precorrin-6y C5,15-methyltransferase (decarboxylating) subunit CbiE [Lachnospiraceae bacterium]